MKKSFLALVLCCFLLSSSSAWAKTLEFTMGSNFMYESDGGISKHELENAPYTKNDRTMVPVRIISEKFGADVGWDGEKSQVTIKKDDKTIILTLGSTDAIVNSDSVALDASPEEINGRTMVPLRFISETLGMDVGYIASTSQVLISDEQPVLTINDTVVTIDDYRAFLAYGADYTPGMDGEEEYINYITSVIVQFYAAMQNIAPRNAPDYTQVKSVVSQISDAIYKKALVAPLAQLFEADMLISTAIGEYVESQAFAEIVQKVYSTDYICAKHILILSDGNAKEDPEKTAGDILAKVKKGEDFDELMDKYCQDPGVSQFPNGYIFTKGEMVPEFEAAAFSLKPGEVSDVIKTSYGYHIIKREELPETDAYTIETIWNRLANDVYISAINDSIDMCKITQYKTTEEIIEMLK